ncbi:hypothetical protein L1887_62750 [Cichorium endivia]|nr:hypothetical protein L1887_62750 [Cichorium endivia]
MGARVVRRRKRSQRSIGKNHTEHAFTPSTGETGWISFCLPSALKVQSSRLSAALDEFGWVCFWLELVLDGYQMGADKDVERSDFGEEAHLVDVGDLGIHHFALERFQHDGLVGAIELGQSRARDDFALANVDHSDHLDDVSVFARAGRTLRDPFHARMRWPKLRLLANRDANWGRALPTPSVYKSTQRRAQAHPSGNRNNPPRPSVVASSRRSRVCAQERERGDRQMGEQRGGGGRKPDDDDAPSKMRFFSTRPQPRTAAPTSDCRSAAPNFSTLQVTWIAPWLFALCFSTIPRTSSHRAVQRATCKDGESTFSTAASYTDH